MFVSTVKPCEEIRVLILNEMVVSEPVISVAKSFTDNLTVVQG